MSEAAAVVETLKRALKARRLTYAKVAAHLNMSEANIKRMFAQNSMALDRVEAICRLMHMDLMDLFELYDADRHRLTQLTEDQERELVAESLVLMVAVAVRNHLSFKDILATHHITEPDLIRSLVKLDRLNIISLLPNNHIKLRIDEAFSWIPNGPIEQFYLKAIQQEFLAGQFEQGGRLFSFGLLSDSSAALMQDKLAALMHEFTQLVRQDQKLPWGRKRSVAMLTALRPFEFSILKPYVKTT